LYEFVILYQWKQSKKKIASGENAGINTRVKTNLDKYADKVLFPAKLAKANTLLKGVKVPS
jgi:hypothetical protein